ncbi:hypothetical protein Maq22A_c28640 [Methylobacterium aquaticum]|uniref:Uncharacterized protein n=1 Tax=Methylobacterium aquaticum TaxID=270351 RepID=A0A1Y0ZIR1_9HYPH|nr:hypothetical protein Maq22A_c28640 [Methylobacterium aquaticum]
MRRTARHRRHVRPAVPTIHRDRACEIPGATRPARADRVDGPGYRRADGKHTNIEVYRRTIASHLPVPGENVDIPDLGRPMESPDLAESARPVSRTVNASSGPAQRSERTGKRRVRRKGGMASGVRGRSWPALAIGIGRDEAERRGAWTGHGTALGPRPRSLGSGPVAAPVFPPAPPARGRLPPRVVRSGRISAVAPVAGFAGPPYPFP